MMLHTLASLWKETNKKLDVHRSVVNKLELALMNEGEPARKCDRN